MWTRKKDELTMTAGQQSTVPSEPPTFPAPSRSVGVGERAAASIGKSVVVKGQIESREDLYIDGEIEGTVTLENARLTVGPNGRLKADIRAREVVIFGTVQGNVEGTERVEIKKEARLIGDIKTARIMIEDGAYFKGSIDVIRKAPATASQPAAAEPVSNAPGDSAKASTPVSASTQASSK